MPITPDIAAAEAAIVEMTNAFRAENRLPPVRSNPTLQAAARTYAKKLGKFDALSHTADGTSPAERVAKAGYRWDVVRALPPMRRTKDPAEARRTLEAIRDA